ncbi:signal peptidase I [Candidatus Woesearchaeota archaeon]|nr:signal peptidase I [Candidatus Woesearchaeota archaeon]
MDWKKIKRGWKKVWYFIWEDDSWASWLVNVILAFILIKFVVYPVLGLVLSTSHPIVAVVSSSMDHDGSFDDWWASNAVCGDAQCTQEEFYAQLGITKDQFKDFRFKNGFNRGDIMLLYGTNHEKLKVGDVIVFKANRPDPVIHRIIIAKQNNSHHTYSTKGDHNIGTFYFESNVPEENYIGKAVIRVPLLGYIKIGFVKLLQLVGIV